MLHLSETGFTAPASRVLVAGNRPATEYNPGVGSVSVHPKKEVDNFNRKWRYMMTEILNLFEERNWEDAPEYSGGSRKKVLHDENGFKTILLKLPGDFYMAPHAHIAAEQHLVLKGEYISEGTTCREGTYRFFEAHENHGPFESKSGALVLVIWHPSSAENQV